MAPFATTSVRYILSLNDTHSSQAVTLHFIEGKSTIQRTEH